MKTNELSNSCNRCNRNGYQIDSATGMLIYIRGLAGGYLPCGCEKGRVAMAEYHRILRMSWPWWKRASYWIGEQWRRMCLREDKP